MSQVHHPTHSNDPRVVILDRGDYTTCTIFLKGGYLTSWRIHNEEQIFVSRVAKMDNYYKIRGGISIVFPHWDQWKYGPNNGFSRDTIWRIRKGPKRLVNGDVYVEIYLQSNKYTRSLWNYEFELRYSITLKFDSLETKMVVVNPSLHFSFEFNFEHHVYLRVRNINTCTLSGLQNIWYIDNLDKNKDICKKYQRTEDLKLEGRMDRSYIQSPNQICLNNIEEQKVVKVIRKGLPDLHIWNPYETVKEGEELDRDEVQYFLAADSGNVYCKMLLAPNSVWTSSETLLVVKNEQKTNIDMLLQRLYSDCSPSN